VAESVAAAKVEKSLRLLKLTLMVLGREIAVVTFWIEMSAFLSFCSRTLALKVKMF